MILVVGAEKGGVGKSTLSINIAAVFAESGKSVILIDTDTQRSASAWSSLREHSGHDRAFTVVEKVADPMGTIVDLSSKYDVVVVDVGARDYDRLAELAKIADLWIAPTRVGQSDLQSTVQMALAFEAVEKKHKRGSIPLAVVINATPGPWNSKEGADAAEALRASLPIGVVVDQCIRDRRVWRDSQRLGKTILEMPASQAAQAQEELVAVIEEALKLVEVAHG